MPKSTFKNMITVPSKCKEQDNDSDGHNSCDWNSSDYSSIIFNCLKSNQ